LAFSLVIYEMTGHIDKCIDDIFYWKTESRLKLNADKTEFSIISTERQGDRIKNIFPVPLLSQYVMPAVLA